MKLPPGDKVATDFVCELIDRLAVFVPVRGVEVAVVGAGDSNGNGFGKNLFEDIFRPPRVVIGSHDNHALPALAL